MITIEDRNFLLIPEPECNLYQILITNLFDKDKSIFITPYRSISVRFLLKQNRVNKEKIDDEKV